jgi:hypothetical protein
MMPSKPFKIDAFCDLSGLFSHNSESKEEACTIKDDSSQGKLVL